MNYELDSKQYVNVLRDRIRAAAMDLIPEEQLDKLIQSEIEAFFTPDANFIFESKQTGYGNTKMVAQVPVSPFRVIVWDQLRAIVSPMLEKALVARQEHLKDMLEDYFKQKVSPDFNEGFDKALDLMAQRHLKLQVAESMQFALINLRSSIQQEFNRLNIPANLY